MEAELSMKGSQAKRKYLEREHLKRENLEKKGYYIPSERSIGRIKYKRAQKELEKLLRVSGHGAK